ncbi:hypothetical protein TWF696_009915 [Orbilia brochopaga]|uniref:Secreted protein n=1 Tax=Orbilia brochopaga TaxID=3140254 RepID=A0AAV9U9J5_9PEZI
MHRTYLFAFVAQRTVIIIVTGKWCSCEFGTDDDDDDELRTRAEAPSTYTCRVCSAERSLRRAGWIRELLKGLRGTNRLRYNEDAQADECELPSLYARSTR